MKLIFQLGVLFFCLSLYAQNSEFKQLFSMPNDSVSIDFKKYNGFELLNIHNNSFSIKEETKIEEPIKPIKFQYNFFDKDIIPYKSNPNDFLNHCSALKDGLTTDYKSEDVIIGRIFDAVINDMLAKKLFKKQSD